jgi:hypothetical protein
VGLDQRQTERLGGFCCFGTAKSRIAVAIVAPC